MTVERFAIHTYEFNRTAAQYPGAFLVEGVSEGGMVEGIYLSAKPLTLAMDRVFADMERGDA